MLKPILLSAAFAATLLALPAHAAPQADCWGLKKPGDIVVCLAPNSFGGNVQKAAEFYGQWHRTYKKDPLPVLNIKTVKYAQIPGTNNFNLMSNDGQVIGVIRSGNITVSLPPNLVAAGGGNLIGNDGSTIGLGVNLANALMAQLNKNPPVVSVSNYRIQGVNDLRSLQARSAGRA